MSETSRSGHYRTPVFRSAESEDSLRFTKGFGGKLSFVRQEWPPMAAQQAVSASLPLDSPERRRLPLLLRRAWYGLNQAFRRRIAHLGLTPDQFTVMRTLLENDGITQRELAKLMSSDPNTVASLLARMEKARLVHRQAHEKDKRAHRLRLKPAGRRKYEAARVIAIAMQAEVLSVLPEEVRESFLENLDQVAEGCRQAAQKPPPNL